MCEVAVDDPLVAPGTPDLDDDDDPVTDPVEPTGPTLTDPELLEELQDLADDAAAALEANDTVAYSRATERILDLLEQNAQQPPEQIETDDPEPA